MKNETYESRTDPEARLMRRGKGKEAKLVFMGHALMEDRNGLLMDFVVSVRDGHDGARCRARAAGLCARAGFSSQDAGR